MSAGVPAIVTHVGDNPEIVVNQQTGWIIPSDDPAAMAAALTDAASDSQKNTPWEKTPETASWKALHLIE